ncbi:MAG: LysR family transcriptional regulator [Hyphomicrobiales bacterium]|nr:LysR family transcriptional regulator [Hyphomicrobiales bacterium]
MMKKNNLTLSLLVAFSEVAEKRNMVRAAESLGISQPAISMQLARLTDIIGAKLFHETKRYELTDVGARVLADARTIISMVEKLPNAVNIATSSILNIGFSIDAFEFAQSIVTNEFSGEHLFKIHCLDSGDTLSAALDGDLDLAVVFLPPDFTGTTIGEIPCQLVISAFETQARVPNQPSKDTMQINLATYGPSCPYRMTTLKYLSSSQLPFQHTYIASSPIALLEIIRSRKGCAPFPLFLRDSRYANAPYSIDFYLPAVRLALLSNNPQFRIRNQQRLWRILNKLRTTIAAAEQSNRI